MKVCNKCNRKLSTECFFKNKKSKDGYRGVCKECENTASNYIKNCLYCGKKVFIHDKCARCRILLHDNEYNCENCGKPHTLRGLNSDLCQECDNLI